MARRNPQKPSSERPSDGATYERARRLANSAMWTVALQHRRLKTDESEDGQFLFRRWADFQFLIVALSRLHQSAMLASKVPSIASAMKNAISEFDYAIPKLKNMRDVAEHIDDYAIDEGNDRTVSRKSLEVGAIDDSSLNWLGYQLNADSALVAAEKLFKEIQDVATAVARDSTVE